MISAMICSTSSTKATKKTSLNGQITGFQADWPDSSSVRNELNQ